MSIQPYYDPNGNQISPREYYSGKMPYSFVPWLQKNSQPTPRVFQPVENAKGMSPNYFLTPENMMALINAFSVYDLYQKPDYTPKSGMFDYPTSAFNLQNLPIDVGIQNAIVQASENPKSKLSYLQTAENYNFPIQDFGAQGIYQHEIAHEQDPRFNKKKMWSYPNQGYTTRNRLSGGILQRENPAMKAEDIYWDSIIKALKEKGYFK